jgi:hypothetical protein
MSTSTLDDIAGELASETAAQAQRREQSLRQYFTLMSDPAGDGQLLRALITELDISPGDFQRHRQAFKEFHAAVATAPTADSMARLVQERSDAERAVIQVEQENAKNLRDAKSRQGAARAAEGNATAAVTTLRDAKRGIESLFPELYPPAAKAPAAQFAQSGVREMHVSGMSSL